MIRHLIGQDFPAMDIGPEPSAGIFQVVMAGTEERTIKGAALCIVDELPYQGLGAFGASFLGKFQAGFFFLSFLVLLFCFSVRGKSALCVIFQGCLPFCGVLILLLLFKYCIAKCYHVVFYGGPQ